MRKSTSMSVCSRSINAEVVRGTDEVLVDEYRILFYKCRACKTDFRDKDSLEGREKDEQRLAREERLAAKNKKGGKPDAKPEGNAMQQVLAAKPTPAPGPAATIAMSGTGNMDSVEMEESDDDDY
jgi:hypothetical protein